MSTRPLFTWLGLLFAAAGLLLGAFGFSVWIAGLCAVTAYFLAAKDFSSFTGTFQAVMQLVAAAVLGFALGFGDGLQVLLFTTAMLVTALATFGRMMFFTTFRYINYSWLEPALLAVAVALFVFANVNQTANLAAWLLPLPLLVFAGVIARGIQRDKKQLAPAAAKGYQVTIGKQAPVFALPDENGQLIQLSDFAGQRHLLLVFVRGDWCPGCHMMLRAYQREHKRLQEKNIHVLCIGPDPAGTNRNMVERLGLSFHVLADEGQQTAMRYGVQLQEYDNDFAEKYEEGIPLPASFLIDKSGKVLYVSRPDRVGEFLNPDLIFPIIDAL